MDSSPTGTNLSFNVIDRNPNRHIDIYYDVVHASVHFYDALMASGPAFAASWYQPNKTTNSITCLLDVVGPSTADTSWSSFSATVHARRILLSLHLITAIRFRVSNTLHSGRQKMHVSCDLLISDDGNLLSESVGAAYDRYL
jgi:hypothetical protein